MDPSVGGCSARAEEMFKDQYPVVYAFLEQHKAKLLCRNRAETGIRYEWYALQRWGAKYWREFLKPKIIYPNMTKYLPFYYDEHYQFYGNQKCFIVTSDTESLPYLTAVLNSLLFRCCFRDNFPELLGNAYELSKILFEKIPIRKPTEPEATLFEELVRMVQLAKSEGLDVPAAFLEELIDACVLEMYFPEEALSKNLLFMDKIREVRQAVISLPASSLPSDSILECFCYLANAPKHPIRNQLNRLVIDSPDFFAVIKREGRV